MFEVMSAKETEVSSRPQRRRFTAEYRRRIVKEAEACAEVGQVGALLRREGLYSSHLASWRRATERAELAAQAPRKRGPKPKFDERDRRLVELQRENDKLKARAERAELLVEIQKKVASVLGIPLHDSDEKL